DNEPYPKLAQRQLFSTDASRSIEGLNSEYFATADFGPGPLRTSVEKRFFRFMGVEVPPGTPMGYRWTGYVWPRQSGVHEFSIRGRGHARLMLDGRELISPSSPVREDQDDLTGSGSVRRLGSATLEGGRGYSVTLEFAWLEMPRSLQYMHLGVREPS